MQSSISDYPKSWFGKFFLEAWRPVRSWQAVEHGTDSEATTGPGFLLEQWAKEILSENDNVSWI